VIIAALLAVVIAALVYWVAVRLGLPQLIAIIAAILVILGILGPYT
jgi:hypothetical protein